MEMETPIYNTGKGGRRFEHEAAVPFLSPSIPSVPVGVRSRPEHVMIHEIK
jgi:hypothetical protein